MARCRGGWNNFDICHDEIIISAFNEEVKPIDFVDKRRICEDCDISVKIIKYISGW